MKTEGFPGAVVAIFIQAANSALLLQSNMVSVKIWNREKYNPGREYRRI